MTAPPPAELDPRGRRLRAALAALLVADDTSWGLVQKWLDSRSGIGLVRRRHVGTRASR
jgi:hypothetical protein